MLSHIRQAKNLVKMVDETGTVLPGREYTFTCQVNCTVDLDCSIRWPLRGSILTSAYFSVRKNILKWIPSVPGTVQVFTCVVENTAAGRSAEASKTVKVTGSHSRFIV